MKNITIIMLVVLATALAAVSGCDVEAQRRHRAQQNFEQRMDQVRLEQAREAMDQGRYQYAQRVLTPVLDSPQRQHEAHRLMNRIQTAEQIYTQMAEYRSRDDDERVY